MISIIVPLVLGALLLGTAAFAGHWLTAALLGVLAVLLVWLVGAAVRVATDGGLPALVPTRGARYVERGADRRRAARSSADSLAVVALLCATTGLFLLNVVLGPLATALGVAALHRGARLRPTAILAAVLGVVDVVLFTTMVGHALHHGRFLFQFGS